jgi:hypothetical protein
LAATILTLLVTASFLCPMTVHSAQLSLAWDANGESDIAGYSVYYGLSSGSYSSKVDVGNQTSYTIDGLQGGLTCYFAVTAYDNSGNESGYSNEVVYAVSSDSDQGYMVIPQSQLGVISVDSEETAGEDGSAENAIDGSSSTFWHTEWSQSEPEYPHEVVISLGGSYRVGGFRYLPRQDGTLNGTVANYSIYVSDDGASWGDAVAVGSFAADAAQKDITLTEKTGQYLKFTAESEINGEPWASAAEINILGAAVSGGTEGSVNTGSPGNQVGGEIQFDSAAPSSAGMTVMHNWFAVDAKETPMVGDFNGDGMTDIITFTRDNPNAVGDVYVALSEGDHFGDNSLWNDWFAVSSDETVVIGDYNGDGTDDIATWLGKGSRQVYVAESYGSGMDSSAVWMNSIGNNGDDVLKAGDVDGDGLDDLVLFARQQGVVYVARSNGGGFGAPEVWHNWFAVSSYERPEVGDIDGDGRADIITFCTDSPTAKGDVFVALSTGQMFEDGQYSAKWHDWFGVSPTETIRIADIDGDGRSDFLTFLGSQSGQVYNVYSEGSYLSSNYMWAENFASSSSDVSFAGDVNGDGKADLIDFHQSQGQVYVLLTP